MSGQILPNIQNVILILSGKGGVGKSTTACQLALSLRAFDKKVGLLDIDLCGPSIPKMLAIQDYDVNQSGDGWIPVNLHGDCNFKVMSIGFLLKDKDNAIIWRGPKKNAMIKQFLNDVNWGELDYLIIDTPPGTSDEHISVAECLKSFHHPDGAILVTTPQALSIGDVRREISFCKKAEIEIIGIIENMSGYVCPHCSECTNIFSKGGGESLSQFSNLPFLGSIPIEPKLGQSAELGENFLENFKESETACRFKIIAENVISKFENSNQNKS